MGTRAAFWIGDPRDTENCEWLGCIAWDGYPDGDCKNLADATSEQHFRNLVDALAMDRDDFAEPSGGWPFPWADDVFCTDCTYAFFNGKVQYTSFYRKFMPLADYLALDDEGQERRGDESDDPSMKNVDSGRKWNRSQPDSIMYLRG